MNSKKNLTVNFFFNADHIIYMIDTLILGDLNRFK